ncbi:SCO7613 C-terminal domain-containing membrane protein [Nocardioides sp. NPDC051685]|uniref:SCO7613 C-terminal domain-containing membrane protein n=1 Tax=Nocardioides sp. NPDC051685 TaxID=3364334 RepID=UPI0037A77E82
MKYADPGRCPDCREAFEPGTSPCPHCGLPLENAVAQELYGTLLRADVLMTRLRSIREEASRAARRTPPPAPAPLPAAPPAAPPQIQPEPVATPLAAPAAPAATAVAGPAAFPGAPLARRAPITVPLILVGVGVLFLLVAGVIFLAVAWAAMGLGGRTTMLLVFTALFTIGGALLMHLELRAGTEGVWTLALGLLALDIAGMKYAGWLDGADWDRGFLVIVGIAVFLAGTAMSLVGARSEKLDSVIGPQVAAAAGVLTALIGLELISDLIWFPLIAAVIALVVVIVASKTDLQALTIGSMVVMAGFWLLLIVRGLADPALTGSELLRGGTLPLLLGAAAVLTVVALLFPLPKDAKVAMVGVSFLITAYTFTQPALDDGAITLTVVAVIVTLIAAGALMTLPRPWRWAAAALTPYAAGLSITVLILTVSAAVRLAAVPWTESAFDAVTGPEPLLPGWLTQPAQLAILALGTAWFYRANPPAFRTYRPTIGWIIIAGGLSGFAVTAACYGAPLLVPALLLLGVAVALAWWAERRPRLVAAGIFGVVALATALPSDLLTVVVALALAGVAAYAGQGLVGADREVTASYSAVTLTLGLWSLAPLIDVERQWAACVIVTVLGLITFFRFRASGWWATVACAAISIGIGAVDVTWAAVMLTLATILAAAIGLHHRQPPALAVAGTVGIGAATAAVLSGDVQALVVTVILTALAVLVDRMQSATTREVATAYWILALTAAVWQAARLADVDRPYTAVVVVVAMGVIVLVRRSPAIEAAAATGAAVSIGLGAFVDGWTFDTDWLAILLLIAGVMCIATILRHEPQQSGPRLTIAGLLGLGSLGAAFGNDLLALVVAGVLTAAAIAVDRLTPEQQAKAVTAPYWIITLTAFCWMFANLNDITKPHAAAGIIVILAAVTVFRLLPSAEIAAAVAAVVTIVVGTVSFGPTIVLTPDGPAVTGTRGVDLPWLSILLVLAGAAVSAHAIAHHERRWLGWVGASLATVALWIRLADTSTATWEVYTLPPAIALVVFGVVKLRLDREVASLPVLGPGVFLALIPSVPAALQDPVSMRTAVLGIACLAFILGGAWLRWAAPLVGGALVASVLALAQMPSAESLQQWWVLGAAGLLLLFLGITWEARLHDLRRATAYVRGLR